MRAKHNNRKCIKAFCLKKLDKDWIYGDVLKRKKKYSDTTSWRTALQDKMMSQKDTEVP